LILCTTIAGIQLENMQWYDQSISGSRHMFLVGRGRWKNTNEIKFISIVKIFGRQDFAGP